MVVVEPGCLSELIGAEWLYIGIRQKFSLVIVSMISYFVVLSAFVAKEDLRVKMHCSSYNLVANNTTK